MDGALNDEPTKKPILDAVLGAAVALFFGGGTYALFLRSGGQLSVPADPTDRQFVENPRYKGWRKKFTDEELEWLGGNRPTKAQEAAILAEIEGVVELGDKKRGKRTIIVKALDDAGEEIESKEHAVPQGKHLRVHKGDEVQAGEALVDGPQDPHDILKIKEMKI